MVVAPLGCFKSYNNHNYYYIYEYLIGFFSGFQVSFSRKYNSSTLVGRYFFRKTCIPTMFQVEFRERDPLVKKIQGFSLAEKASTQSIAAGSVEISTVSI